MRLVEYAIFTLLSTISISAVCDADRSSQDLIILAASTTYAWGAVGTLAATSESERIARRLIKTVKEDQLIERLHSATPEGKMYVMCLLRYKNRRAFIQKQRDLQAGPGIKVSTMVGDILRYESMKKVLRQIEIHGCSPLRWKMQ